MTITSVQNPSNCESIVMAAMMCERNYEDNRRKALSVSAGMKRRPRKGHAWAALGATIALADPCPAR